MQRSAVADHARPGISRLARVELRKMVDTRAGLWLQIATVALTVTAVVVRTLLGDVADHSFAAVLDVAVKPAAVLLPIAGILLVTSEWSQSTGMTTFTLVPARSRVLTAKLIASLVLAGAVLAMSVAVAALGVTVVSPDAAGTWSGLVPLVGQSAIYLAAGMVTGVAFGAVLLTSAPSIVALFALPIAWTAVASLALFSDVAPWLDTRLALGPLPKEILDPMQWAHVGTAVALWTVLPLLLGISQVSRRDVAG
jgi:hypothetical protein